MKNKHLLLALLSVTLWGINFPLMKFVILELPPLLSISLRLSISSLACLPFVPIPKNHWKVIFLLSVSLFTITMGSTMIALKEVDSSIVSLMTELEVPFAAFLSYFLLKEKLSKKQIIGTLIAFVGVYLIIESPEISATKLWPMWLLIIAAFFYALSAIIIKMIKDIDAFTITVWSSAFAVPQLLIMSLILEDQHLPLIVSLPYNLWMTLAISAAFNITAFYLWNSLLRTYTVNQVIPFSMLIPASSLVASYFLLGETTHPLALAGGGLALLGVWIQSRGNPQTTSSN